MKNHEFIYVRELPMHVASAMGRQPVNHALVSCLLCGKSFLVQVEGMTEGEEIYCAFCACLGPIWGVPLARTISLDDMRPWGDPGGDVGGHPKSGASDPVLGENRGRGVGNLGPLGS